MLLEEEYAGLQSVDQMQEQVVAGVSLPNEPLRGSEPKPAVSGASPKLKDSYTDFRKWIFGESGPPMIPILNGRTLDDFT